MLELVAKSCEGCAEFQFTDATGTYDAVTNPTGYGTYNGVASPSAFDTYVLEVRYPGTAVTADPDFTFNLLTSVPSPDSSGYYTWPAITASQMGLDTLISGVWTFTARGTLDSAEYIADVQCIFVNDLAGDIDDVMKEYDPVCGCKKGCEDPAEIYAAFLTVKCSGVCDLEKAQQAIDSLYARTPLCC